MVRTVRRLDGTLLHYPRIRRIISFHSRSGGMGKVIVGGAVTPAK
jgi:hypothetical protein